MTIDQVVAQTAQALSQISGEIVLALVAMCVLLSLALLLNLRQTRKLVKQLSRVQHDLKVSTHSMINIGQQLLNLEKKVNQQPIPEPATRRAHSPSRMNNVDYRAPQSVQAANLNMLSTPTDDAASNDNGDSIYDKARYYLAKGDDVESIAKRCNLSHAEVSLLKALSKKPAETF